MNGCQKSSLSGHPYSSLYSNPLNDLRHSRSCSDYTCLASKGEDPRKISKEEIHVHDNKENVVSSINGSSSLPKHFSKSKSLSTDRILKPSSLQFCMQMNEAERGFGSKLWDPFESEKSSTSLNIWDYSDSEAAPASSWSTLPNK